MDGVDHTGDDDVIPPLSSGPNWSRVRSSANDPGAESDGSLPSLQTVSDSSEAESSDGDYDDEDEDEDGEEDENDYESDQEGLPRLPFTGATTSQGGAQPRRNSEREVDENEGPFHMFPAPTTSEFRESIFRTALNLARLDENYDPPRSAAGDLMFRSILGAMHPPRFVLDELLRAPSQPDHDPHRAQIIMERLEVVPEELVDRYEKLRGGTNEDDFDGCAICREVFLPYPPSEISKETIDIFAALPYHEYHVPSILAFPCPGMHLFHDTCISPWLARKTTCPSCRFDVDPNSLTLRRDDGGRHPQARRMDKFWEPPKGKPFKKWLEDEENKQNGIVRPDESDVTDSLPIPQPFVRRGPFYEDDGDDEDDESAWEDTDDEDDMPSRMTMPNYLDASPRLDGFSPYLARYDDEELPLLIPDHISTSRSPLIPSSSARHTTDPTNPHLLTDIRSLGSASSSSSHPVVDDDGSDDDMPPLVPDNTMPTRRRVDPASSSSLPPPPQSQPPQPQPQPSDTLQQLTMIRELLHAIEARTTNSERIVTNLYNQTLNRFADEDEGVDGDDDEDDDGPPPLVR